ncbi:hypothetical protein Vadar_016784 [Vaccinium darrowii]|uniref:Uncharacterized protein n=1 Tax=Vaccinium darrowii TaxID=229202 RepID=A0ACB7XA97_9ERIC|nr:hypothetical protein Vadar_016784 [Vaccinium darrowii]
MRGVGKVRNQNDDCIPVIANHRKHTNTNGNQSLLTLFVDNLPEDVNLSWLKHLFNKFGVVKDASIPTKRSKVSGRRFGFVHYNCQVSAMLAISKTHGLWIEDRRLFVKSASFNNKWANNCSQNRKRNFSVDLGSTKGKNNSETHKETSDVGKNKWFNGAKSFAQVVGTVQEGGKANKQEWEGDPKNHKLFIRPADNGWLYRSIVAKLHKFMVVDALEEGNL